MLDVLKSISKAIDFHVPTAIITLVVVVLVYFAFIGIINTFKNKDE